MSRAPKFSYYEVVFVSSGEGGDSGTQGVVLGITQDTDSMIYYSVHDLQSETSRMVAEPNLRATGRKLSRSDIYDGVSIRVIADVEGKGSAAEPDPVADP